MANDPAQWHDFNDKAVDLLFKSQARLFWAIAGAESGYNCKVISKTGDYGFFQIHLSAHPEYSKTEVLECWGNIRASYLDISRRGTNPYPWVAYTNGNYLSYY